MEEKLIIQGFNQFGGKHCQTAALKNVLDYHGLHLSEEMLLGLGRGIGFIYWYVKVMPSPFIGTRYGKGEEFLIKICERIGGHTIVVFGIDEEENKVYISDRGKNYVTSSIEDLKKKDLKPLLANLQQKILNCYEIEEKAFQTLNDIVK